MDMGSLTSLRSSSTDSDVIMHTVKERDERPLSPNHSPLPSLLMQEDDNKETSSTPDVPVSYEFTFYLKKKRLHIIFARFIICIIVIIIFWPVQAAT